MPRERELHSVMSGDFLVELEHYIARN